MGLWRWGRDGEGEDVQRYLDYKFYPPSYPKVYNSVWYKYSVFVKFPLEREKNERKSTSSVENKQSTAQTYNEKNKMLE